MPIRPKGVRRGIRVPTGVPYGYPSKSNLECPGTHADLRVREESHFKFGEINRLGSGGGDQTCYFFLAKNLVKSPKKSYLRPENKGGPKIEKRSFFGIQNVN